MFKINNGYQLRDQCRVINAESQNKGNGLGCSQALKNGSDAKAAASSKLRLNCFARVFTQSSNTKSRSVTCANNVSSSISNFDAFCSYGRSIIYALLSVIMHTDWQQQRLLLILLITSYLICPYEALLVLDDDPNNDASISIAEDSLNLNRNSMYNLNVTNTRNTAKPIVGKNASSSSLSTGYLDKLDNLERSVAAVLIKVAYGTTSTTKRSIPDNSYVLGLTTVATPLLTTLRYQSPHQQQSTSSRHRNYELDLERDHALPTSAPNADILKSNNNPTYPNPNRHHSHERDRHRHIYNSTPMPSIPNLLKKTSGQPPTIPMYPGDIPSYSPPSRSFFTPPLPPEYQNPFADKPTLRGTNNEGIIANTGTYINRRPIPPPSLMPGHERIPFRPPDLAASIGNTNAANDGNVSFASAVESKSPVLTTTLGAIEVERKKAALNTPSRTKDGNANEGDRSYTLEPSSSSKQQETAAKDVGDVNKRPNIRRILTGSYDKKGDIPEVLLKQVTQRPIISYHQPPSSPIVLIENAAKDSVDTNNDNSATSPYINQSKQTPSRMDDDMANKVKSSIDSTGYNGSQIATTPSAAAAIGEAAATSSSSFATTSAAGQAKHSPTFSSSGGTVAAAAASAHTTWTWAWNIHIYLSVVLFTILSVYSLYKMLTYNKLTHLFSQSYFICIHLILITICITRIFYLCFDAYNIHGSFHIFVAELLLNLPATFLTVSFSVLILFLFLKSLNHKNNRYSALIRPLTVVVGCGVHVVLCITLHYVESYTLQNHHNFLQQQQQHQYYRQQQHRQHQQPNYLQATLPPAATLANPPPPPRVLTLICQIIYIFVCLSLGLLYLYLYRILKRILRSKSQNYIHGYQNLSYAIHITIATALLFVLLAALQIFGAVFISTARPLMTQSNIEVDWLQWGYQFSLRLIEIAIITLISWVTGLKTSVGNNTGAPVNGEARIGAGAVNGGVYGSGNNSANGDREKHTSHHPHTNVANFFLPCTSSSSQEQFETDYPAICNANTNLHTYTMRTGKLIYDDSYALNSLGPTASPGAYNSAGHSGRAGEYQLQEPMYQRPYDTGSIRSAVNHNITEYCAQPTHGQRYQLRGQHQYGDYMTDATTDHYENPNFDLRASSATGVGVQLPGGVGTMQKLGKTANSTAALSSGGSGSGSGSGSSGTSQQQMLLLQSDSCYSEPLQENSSYEFNNFERPIFKEKPLNSAPAGDECWPERERERERQKNGKSRDRKLNSSTLERGGYENPERRSSNSTNSCSSSNGGGGRYASCGTYERGYFNGVRKSGTLNNIVNNNGNAGAAGRAIATGLIPASAAAGQRGGAQTLALSDRQHYYQRSGRLNNARGGGVPASKDLKFIHPCSDAPVNSHPLKQQQQQQYHPNSDEEEDDMISGSNVECTNLINNEHGSCLTTESTPAAVGIKADQGFVINAVAGSANGGGERLQLNTHTKSIAHLHVQNNLKQIHQQPFSQEPSMQSSEMSAASSASSNCNSNSNSCTTSSASDSMLVAEQGFLRFRALENVGSNSPGIGQTVGIHGASVRHQSRGAPASNCSINGIDC